jgi:hypothetical protein
MPQHDRYLLQIWRSRAVSGRQWVARMDRLSDGERLRFTDPEALLQHVRALIEAESLNHGEDEIGQP